MKPDVIELGNFKIPEQSEVRADVIEADPSQTLEHLDMKSGDCYADVFEMPKHSQMKPDSLECYPCEIREQSDAISINLDLDPCETSEQSELKPDVHKPDLRETLEQSDVKSADLDQDTSEMPGFRVPTVYRLQGDLRHMPDVLEWLGKFGILKALKDRLVNFATEVMLEVGLA